MLILTQNPKNMNCKEFEHWLSSRDIHEAILPDAAVSHMAVCRNCERLFKIDDRLEQEIKTSFSQAELPEGFAGRISSAIDQDRNRRISKRMIVAAGAAAIVLLIFFLNPLNFFSPSKMEPFSDLNQVSLQAVQDHLAGNRYMSFSAAEADHALDILTRELGFKVLLPDFNAHDCILLGGRLCALGNCRAAYFVLEKQGRTGSLFIMDTRFLNFDMADGSRFSTRIKGCDASVWKDNGQVYAMVF